MLCSLMLALESLEMGFNVPFSLNEFEKPMLKLVWRSIGSPLAFPIEPMMPHPYAAESLRAAR